MLLLALLGAFEGPTRALLLLMLLQLMCCWLLYCCWSSLHHQLLHCQTQGLLGLIAAVFWAWSAWDLPLSWCRYSSHDPEDGCSAAAVAGFLWLPFWAHQHLQCQQ